MSSQCDLQLTCCKYEVEIKDNITIVKIPESYYEEPLTKAQKEKLLQFEDEFSNRYTDDDNEFVAIVKLGSATPPLISSYRPFRNHRRDDRSRGDKRSWNDQRSYSNNRHSNYSYNNKRKNYGYNNDYRRY